jgi:hypothetical protein
MPTAASPRTFPFPSPCAGCQEMFRRDSVSTAPARADLKVHAPLLSPKRAMNTAHIQARPSEKDIGVSANREPRHAGASIPSIRSLVYTYSGRRNHKDVRRIDPRFDPYVSKHLFGAACCPCPQTAIRSIIGVAAQSPSMPYGMVLFPPRGCCFHGGACWGSQDAATPPRTRRFSTVVSLPASLDRRAAQTAPMRT